MTLDIFLETGSKSIDQTGDNFIKFLEQYVNTCVNIPLKKKNSDCIINELFFCLLVSSYQP